MKVRLFIFTFLLVASIPITSPAAHLLSPGALELNLTGQSPYPPVMSRPLDLLPVGFDTIATADATFYYSHGNFFQKSMFLQKYIQIAPPVGIIVRSIPDGYSFMIDPYGRYLYEYNNVFYVRTIDGYMVVGQPTGA